MIKRAASRKLGSIAQVVALAVVVVAGVLVATAPGETTNKSLSGWMISPMAATTKNPVPADAKSIATGAQIYAQNCTPCHGKTGDGNGPAGQYLSPKPFNLTSASMWEHSDGTLFAMISEGHSSMPGFSGSLSEHQRWDLINYLRTIEPKPKTPKFKASSDARQAISEVLTAYFEIGKALTKKDFKAAHGHESDLSDALEDVKLVETSKFSPKARAAWAASVKSLGDGIAAISGSSDLSSMCKAFAQMSKAVIETIGAFGHAQEHPVFGFDCPKVGQWLQMESQPVSPYGMDNCKGVSLSLYAASK